MSTVTMRMHNALAEKYLECIFGGDSATFYTSRLSSNPVETISNTTCSSDQRYENNECYIINGAFTVRTFYIDSEGSSDRLRKLTGEATKGEATNSSVIRDKAVVDSFSTSLKEIFDSGIFDTSTIAATSFLGISNSVVVSKNEAAVVAGSVIGSLVAVGLICGMLLFAAKGYQRRRSYDEELKDQNSLSLFEDQSQTASGELSPAEHEEDGSVLGPMIFSDNDTLNDTERLEVVARAPSGQRRYTRPPQPASEDDALDELVTMTMLARAKRDLGPRVVPSSPRRYDIEDTVDL